MGVREAVLAFFSDDPKFAQAAVAAMDGGGGSTTVRRVTRSESASGPVLDEYGLLCADMAQADPAWSPGEPDEFDRMLDRIYEVTDARPNAKYRSFGLRTFSLLVQVCQELKQALATREKINEQKDTWKERYHVAGAEASNAQQMVMREIFRLSKIAGANVTPGVVELVEKYRREHAPETPAVTAETALSTPQAPAQVKIDPPPGSPAPQVKNDPPRAGAQSSPLGKYISP